MVCWDDTSLTWLKASCFTCFNSLEAAVYKLAVLGNTRKDLIKQTYGLKYPSAASSCLADVYSMGWA
jgi:hypothetical protein